MSKRQKAKKMIEVKEFDNVIDEYDNAVDKKVDEILSNYQNVILELGCGTGTYTNSLAKYFPNNLYIGIDIQGERIWYGAKEAIQNKLENVLFIRMQIESLLNIIPLNSISEIWITFPDPFPREKQAKKRLTSSRFCEIYKKVLKSNGIIHLKTDSEVLFHYSLNSFKDNGFKKKIILDDITKSKDKILLEIQTYFETKNLKLGKTIKYCAFVKP